MNNAFIVATADYSDLSYITPDQVPPSPYPRKVFPIKLHKLLSNGQHQHLITWLPHGRAWRVIHRDRFVEEVLPNIFGHDKWTSFLRQASDWGFKRVKRGPASGAYYHEVRVSLCILVIQLCCEFAIVICSKHLKKSLT